MLKNESNKIIRFIKNPDLFNVFHYEDNSMYDSTFVMRTLSYYRNVENSRIRDTNETRITQKIGNNIFDREDIQPYYLLASCWSCYEKININELAKQFLFDDVTDTNNGVAIISDINKVSSLIKKITKKCKQPDSRYPHQEIIYYSFEATKDSYSENWHNTVRFLKRDTFRNEHEYRFLFDAINLEPALIDTIIFYVNSSDYIDEIINFGEKNNLLSDYCNDRNIIFNNFHD